MTQSTDTRKPISPDTEAEAEFLNMDFAGPTHVNNLLRDGFTPDEILARYKACYRPAVARYLVAQGEVLRSEFGSDTEAEAFWAHVGEDAAIEQAGISGLDMAQVPDPS